jgi:nitrite reductase/ring-hydroxylating ferredoxin subunit
MSQAESPTAETPNSPEELSHLAEAVDRAVAEIMEHVPEIEGVEVVPTEPEPAIEPAVFQIALPGAAAAGGGSAAEGAGWVAGPPVTAITPEKPVAFEAGETKVIVVRSKEGLRAFRNACGHVSLPLDRAACDLESGTLTCPWHGFTFDTDTGGCFSSPARRLEPFPLREQDGIVWVRPQ